MVIVTAKQFGGIIKKIRKQLKLSQIELAAACGVGPRFVRELEQGKPTCELEKALLVASMLGLKLTATP